MANNNNNNNYKFTPSYQARHRKSRGASYETAHSQIDDLILVDELYSILKSQGLHSNYEGVSPLDNLIKEVYKDPSQWFNPETGRLALGLEEGPLGGLIDPSTRNPASLETAKLVQELLKGSFYQDTEEQMKLESEVWQSPIDSPLRDTYQKSGDKVSILNVIENIALAKQKDKPSRGVGGGMFRKQREPEKMKGIMALLQRLLPGGKTGYIE
tara:strand:- start:444 stop:1082 length:639 start_codon:yes stop_codon:yes gene_type:complete